MEAEILYTAVFETQTTLHFAPSLLEPYIASLSDYAGKADGLEGILQVYDTGQSDARECVCAGLNRIVLDVQNDQDFQEEKAFRKKTKRHSRRRRKKSLLWAGDDSD